MKRNVFAIGIMSIVIFFNSQAFSAQFNFTPRISVGEEYTDNLTLTETDKEDDFLTEVSAGFTLDALWQFRGLTLSFDPGYVWYQDNSQYDSWRLPATLSLWNDFSRRTRLEILDSFLRTEDPLGDVGATSDEIAVTVSGDPTVRREREAYHTNTASARLTHQIGPESSIYGAFLYSILRNDDSNLEDNDRYSPSAGIIYWITNRWGVELNGIYTRGEFEESTDYDNIVGNFTLRRRITPNFDIYGRYAQTYRDNEEETASDYLIYAPSAGFNYNFQRDLSLSLGGGYFYQDFEDSEVDDEKGPFIDAILSKIWDYQRWNARAEGAAGLEQNDFGAERQGFEYFASIGANGTYNFTRRIFGDISLDYRFSDLINQGDRQDHHFHGGVGLGFRPTLWMSILFNYEFNYYETTSDRDNYRENRVSLRLVLSPDRPWKF